MHNLITVSFKHPKRRKLIYREYLFMEDIPKEIRHRDEIYLLYGVH